MGKNRGNTKGNVAGTSKSKLKHSAGSGSGKKPCAGLLVPSVQPDLHECSAAVMKTVDKGNSAVQENVTNVNFNAELCNSLEDSSETGSVSSSRTLGEHDTSEGTPTARQIVQETAQSISRVPESGNSETEANSDQHNRPKLKPTFASLFAGNRQATEGSKLEKFAMVEGPVVIEESDVQSSGNQWKFCLVGYFGGRFPGKQALKQIVDSWKVHTTIHHHNSGWIIFQFQNEEHQMKVLENGPYIVFGRPLLLKIMPQYFRFQNEEISCFPIWIQLRNLPLDLWSGSVLSKICSQLGKPIYMDKLTAQKERVSFARCLVEIDMAKELTYKVMLKLPNGDTLEQPVFYENLPRFCSHCQAVGHSLASCKVKEKLKEKQNSVANDNSHKV